MGDDTDDDDTDDDTDDDHDHDDDDDDDDDTDDDTDDESDHKNDRYTAAGAAPGGAAAPRPHGSPGRTFYPEVGPGSKIHEILYGRRSQFEAKGSVIWK